MGSPLLIGKPNQNKNISEMHKNVLTKNLKEHPGFNQLLFSNKKEEPVEEVKKQVEKSIFDKNSATPGVIYVIRSTADLISPVFISSQSFIFSLRSGIF